MQGGAARATYRAAAALACVPAVGKRRDPRREFGRQLRGGGEEPATGATASAALRRGARASRARGGGRPRGGPGRELGRGNGRARWASRDWAAGRESGVAGRRAGWLRRWLGPGPDWAEREKEKREWAAGSVGLDWAWGFGFEFAFYFPFYFYLLSHFNSKSIKG